MFCELGLGIMDVKCTQGEKIAQEEEIRLLIDGGFALISSNLLTIIASDAIGGRDMEREKIEQMLEKSRRRLTIPPGRPGEFTLQQREHEIKRNALLARL
jgi:F0F1-type ATP synthase epsilon subunit